MTLYLYCPSPSKGVRELSKELLQLGQKVVRLKKASPPGGFKKGDAVVCWGFHHPGVPEGVTLLNNNPPGVGKLTELKLLKEKGITVPPFSLTKQKGWLARSSNHQEGDDLLFGCAKPAFYTEKLPVVREFRVHVIDGKSVRVGERRARVPNPHPWVRSHQAGYGIFYDAPAQEGFNEKGRKLAREAVSVLGLGMAAVDLWMLADGSWVVGEVNRRPGLEGNTTKKYAEKLVALLGKKE